MPRTVLTPAMKNGKIQKKMLCGLRMPLHYVRTISKLLRETIMISCTATWEYTPFFRCLRQKRRECRYGLSIAAAPRAVCGSHYEALYMPYLSPSPDHTQQSGLPAARCLQGGFSAKTGLRYRRRKRPSVRRKNTAKRCRYKAVRLRQRKAHQAAG